MREKRRELKRECLGVLCLKDTQKGFSDFEDAVVVGRGGRATRMVGVFRTVAIGEAQSFEDAVAMGRGVRATRMVGVSRTVAIGERGRDKVEISDTLNAKESF